MGFFSTTVQPQVGTPIVGNATQEAYLNALFGSGISPNDHGGWQFNQMPSYTGQLTPGYNGNLTSTWGAFSPNGGGMPQGMQQWNSIYGAQQGNHPGVQSILNGGAGSAAPQMNMLGSLGTSGIGGDYIRGIAAGTSWNPLQSYFGGGGGNDPLQSWSQGKQPGGAHTADYATSIGTLANPGLAVPPGAPQGMKSGEGPGRYSTSSMPGAGSVGGVQNMPNSPGGGMPGYNASFSNIPNDRAPWQGQMMMGGPGQTTSYLNNIAQGGGAGAPVNQTPAWQAMVDSQNYNINRGANQLAEQFNQGGGLFSTAYGAAQGQYQSDARAQQNAQLLGASTQAMQAANQNQFGAAQQLGQFGFQGGQLGQQLGFQGQQNNLNRQFGAAQQQSAQQYGAAGQMANMQYGAAGQVGQTAANALMAQYGQQNNAALAGMTNQTNLMGMGMQGANQLNNMWNANLGTGAQLGQQQYGMDQNALMANYQQWFANQPYNNPYLQMMNSAAFGYPQMVQPTVTPGWGTSLMGAAGSIMGGLGAMGGSGGIGALFSDKRMKTDIKKIGTFGDIPLYTYKFKGAGDQVHVGVMAQEAFKKYPSAVIKGNKTTPWMVDYSKLAQAALGAN